MTNEIEEAANRNLLIFHNSSSVWSDALICWTAKICFRKSFISPASLPSIHCFLICRITRDGEKNWLQSKGENENRGLTNLSRDSALALVPVEVFVSASSK